MGNIIYNKAISRTASRVYPQQLQADMPVAYTQALAAGQSLLEAGGRLLEDPHSQEGRLLLLSGSQEVLEGTMKVPPYHNITVDSISFHSTLCSFAQEYIKQIPTPRNICSLMCTLCFAPCSYICNKVPASLAGQTH